MKVGSVSKACRSLIFPSKISLLQILIGDGIGNISHRGSAVVKGQENPMGQNNSETSGYRAGHRGHDSQCALQFSGRQNPVQFWTRVGQGEARDFGNSPRPSLQLLAGLALLSSFLKGRQFDVLRVDLQPMHRKDLASPLKPKEAHLSRRRIDSSRHAPFQQVLLEALQIESLAFHGRRIHGHGFSYRIVFECGLCNLYRHFSAFLSKGIGSVSQTPRLGLEFGYAVPREIPQLAGTLFLGIRVVSQCLSMALKRRSEEVLDARRASQGCISFSSGKDYIVVAAIVVGLVFIEKMTQTAANSSHSPCGSSGNVSTCNVHDLQVPSVSFMRQWIKLN
mmetsp:Transcript_3394/g.8073  ORF Transcript_3394/g.8073 Transcript_3394/m.8073 type:complete len:336 (-) Transcript_3394:55-1062(-)